MLNDNLHSGHGFLPEFKPPDVLPLRQLIGSQPYGDRVTPVSETGTFLQILRFYTLKPGFNGLLSLFIDGCITYIYCLI